MQALVLALRPFSKLFTSGLKFLLALLALACSLLTHDRLMSLSPGSAAVNSFLALFQHRRSVSSSESLRELHSAWQSRSADGSVTQLWLKSFFLLFAYIISSSLLCSYAGAFLPFTPLSSSLCHLACLYCVAHSPTSYGREAPRGRVTVSQLDERNHAST